MKKEQSNMKIFSIEFKGRDKLIFGESLEEAFKPHGGVPRLWTTFKKMGLLKTYTLNEWFTKAGGK